MNKKERFCDIDNIVEWRHIITALLALVAMAGQAKKTIVWENPSVAYSAIPYFKIQKVEMTKEQTVLFASVKLMPGLVFRIQDSSNLQANGKQYAITGSDSITLGKWITLDESGKKDFILYFKPLPYSILFAPDGTILARGLRGEELEAKLAEIFNDK